MMAAALRQRQPPYNPTYIEEEQAAAPSVAEALFPPLVARMDRFTVKGVTAPPASPEEADVTNGRGPDSRLRRNKIDIKKDEQTKLQVLNVKEESKPESLIKSPVL